MKTKYSTAIATLVLAACACSREYPAYPEFKCSDTLLVKAYELAVSTVENNIENGLITAGGEYGGEWTRDASINAWNAGSLFFPHEAENSLWAVTENRETIGHQYWDKIIWVHGAWNHYLVTGDEDFLAQAYPCCAATMKQMEDSVFDAEYGMFRGPSVFNDGISGYEYPVYDGNLICEGVLENLPTEKIKCLSTNVIYFMAYEDLAKMALKAGDTYEAGVYAGKAGILKQAIRSHLYDPESGHLHYLIDQNGDVHEFQEGLGCSFAVLAGILTPEEAHRLCGGMHAGKHGLPSIWPDFKRFSAEKPGRHNNLVWPFVNAFYAQAALESGHPERFAFELRNLADLAINKSCGSFLEIYNPCTGLEDGGWQIEVPRHSCKDQTWSATGYIRMITSGLFGVRFEDGYMAVRPDESIAREFGPCSIKAIPYGKGHVDISLVPAGARDKGIYVNGRKTEDAVIFRGSSGTAEVDYCY